MTETLRIPRFVPTKLNWKALNYLGLGIVNATIWGIAFFYLQTAPRTYTSSWTVALPKGGEQANVNLPGIGTASSSAQSPYSSKYDDPRANYQYIATTQPVLQVAASKLNMDVDDFGEPRIKLMDDTMLLQFEFEGTTPNEAQLKSLALHEALEERLNELRTQEAAQKDVRLQSALSTAGQKLKEAQQRLSTFQARSELNSDNQIAQLSSNIEALRKEQVQIIAQHQLSDARLQQLSTTLELSPQQAAEAFNLQTDPYFQQILSDNGKSSATLVDLNSRLTPNNPSVINEQEKQAASQTAMLARSQALLNKPVTVEYLEQLNLNNSPSRQQLLHTLVSVQADKQGLQSQALELDRQMGILENRLKALTQQQIVENNLRRDVQIAEAIFSSTITQLDLRSSDVFGSYPQIQLIEEPSLPTSPSSPKSFYVFAGASFASLFLTTGLILFGLSQSPSRLPRQVEPA
ncbi:GumC family protein [Chroogloeocystis siderophila]|jgi:uncharacterized protein involved in exopolysaccharide biosynthesis|uniref:Polysaccharide chain length determinant N-terminal domain-containing protein n=1 Tax=Chroogloeocystis siderophila 5.2 s.c.1 TaxID=247279 RepID=A0A1U7HYY1_9CHRO|nr:hypothetical protein [Chroogloeocystis siderophila]OKH28814.1 hypothetical protein NIES1031_02645 [Chroogloeocystis siderophila 5.2 s.c.1]